MRPTLKSLQTTVMPTPVTGVSAPVVGGRSQPFLELHPHIDEHLISVFSQPGAPPLPLYNGLLYRITTSPACLELDPANSVRLSVFDGDFYIAQEVL
jgi:hypothetical protein